MTSQPDKLFRDKLESFQRPAPAGAWDRIEGNLSKKNSKIIWIRVAAGVAVLATAAILLWPAEKSTQEIVKTQEENPVKKKAIIQESIEQQNDVANAKNIDTTPLQTAQTESTQKLKKQLPVEKSEAPVKDSLAINPIHESTPLVAEVKILPKNEVDSKTIVYTTAEVNTKFLKKKLSPEATPDDKDASGIQKLIGLAYAAKNSEAGLADLRQKKDDLFALSFGKKKGEN